MALLNAASFLSLTLPVAAIIAGGLLVAACLVLADRRSRSAELPRPADALATRGTAAAVPIPRLGHIWLTEEIVWSWPDPDRYAPVRRIHEARP